MLMQNIRTWARFVAEEDVLCGGFFFQPHGQNLNRLGAIGHFRSKPSCPASRLGDRRSGDSSLLNVALPRTWLKP